MSQSMIYLPMDVFVTLCVGMKLQLREEIKKYDIHCDLNSNHLGKLIIQ